MRALGCLVAFLIGVTALTGCVSDTGSDAEDDVSAEEQAATASGKPLRALKARGRSFVDRKGRIVTLRGINVAGNSKLPPFVPYDDAKSLDALQRFGMNVIRLPFIWEAYEPARGRYDGAYLAAMQQVARDAWARGLYVVVDFHQDGFSRYSIGGCGSGFPRWALNGDASAPNNSAAHCENWATRMLTDWTMHASWSAFYGNAAGVRDSFLEMVKRVSAGFSTVEGVIGYDLLNEPWGWDSELSALYEDEGRRIRAEDPGAILFVEGHISTNTGAPTTLERPAFANLAYAPHFYDVTTMMKKRYDGNPVGIDLAFASLNAKAASWDVPLFVGEYGMFAEYPGSRSYVIREYDNLDALMASGTQWNYSPRWTSAKKDGWNGEDLHIVDPVTSVPRKNFQIRPYPRATAGTPLAFSYRQLNHELDYRWQHDARLGATEISLPRALFGAATAIATRNITCSRNGDVLSCSGASAEASVHVVSPD